MFRTAYLAAALPLLIAAAPALADGFAPGFWEHETKMISADVPGVPQWIIKMFAGDRSRKGCFTPQQAPHPEKLLTQDDEAVCKVRRLSMVDGNLIFDTFCINKRFPEGLLIASKGNYTPNSYQISTIASGTKKGQPVKIVTTGNGYRTGQCK